MDYVGSRVVDVSTVAGVREQRRVRSCFAACVLLYSLVAALRWTETERSPCFLLVAMLLRCCALPPYPRRTNVPASVAVANANALHMPLPPKPGRPVSPVLSVLLHAVGHLRHP